MRMHRLVCACCMHCNMYDVYLFVVSVDPDIDDKQVIYFFLERLTNHLEIKNSLSWKVLQPWRKVLNSPELSFSSAERLVLINVL